MSDGFESSLAADPMRAALARLPRPELSAARALAMRARAAQVFAAGFAVDDAHRRWQRPIETSLFCLVTASYMGWAVSAVVAVIAP
ncbi:MAG: hypothetical protein HY903_14235 [Deltaproteobacteria bacterium]|nr:hypothetical protein [Deltaproteobacteria bacterium]